MGIVSMIDTQNTNENIASEIEARSASEYMYDGEVIFLGRKGTIDKPLYFHGKFWAALPVCCLLFAQKIRRCMPHCSTHTRYQAQNNTAMCLQAALFGF